MKRCPECRRDYYDDSLLYCLEDGAALIQGSVPPPDEPATAIVPGSAVSAEGGFSESATRPQIHTTAAEPQETFTKPSEKQSFSANRTPKPLGIAGVVLVLLFCSFFGYRYYRAELPNRSIPSP